MITQRAKDNIIYRLRDTGDIGEALAHYSYDEADVADALLNDVDFAAKVRCNLNPVNDAYFSNLYDTCDERTAAEATAGMTLLELLARETSTRFSAREDNVIAKARAGIMHRLKASGYIIDGGERIAYATGRRVPAMEAEARRKGIVVIKAEHMPDSFAAKLLKPGWSRYSTRLPAFDPTRYSDTRVVWRGQMSGCTMTELEQAFYIYTLVRCSG